MTSLFYHSFRTRVKDRRKNLPKSDEAEAAKAVRVQVGPQVKEREMSRLGGEDTKILKKFQIRGLKAFKRGILTQLIIFPLFSEGPARRQPGGPFRVYCLWFIPLG